MSSVREIARVVGVSPATVSRVINSDPRVAETVRRRVLEAANKARYVASVGRRPTTNIAFVYTSQPSLGSTYDTAILQGLSDGIELMGLDLVILNAGRNRLDHETYTQMFMRRGVRGAVLRATADSHLICEQIASEGFPSVVVGERFANPRVSFVHAESRPASRTAAEHLIDLGHRRIAICVNGIPDSDHADRLAGFRDAMKARDIEFDDRYAFQAWARRDGGTQLIRQIAAMSRPPTAVFITDPITAVGAFNEARELGVRVPEDLSIIGFDDGEMRYIVHPAMTAVCQDAVAIGRAAFEVLHELLDRKSATAVPRKVLRTWFEVHGSTAPPGQSATIKGSRQTTGQSRRKSTQKE
ncbi:MAG TPA: LacI family DNA-binding transcriptional regulator [Tepidisphaeraceae bacterium]|nr:LacI family DNA-binding transcriptional regulator [Tepidisphaeraceae bacterium]